MAQRYEFFAPIWRVMRDSNMSADEVREQVAFVALVTKRASNVSDLRSHTYAAPAVAAPVVYIRAMTPGVCTYFDDRKGGAAPVPHGACWYDRCHDLRVVDVPGDHFSLLRQDLEDMTVIVTALKMALGPFGWSETLRREDKPAYAVSSEEIQDIDAYLTKMGVKDPGLRRRLEAALPYSSEQGVGSAAAAAAEPVVALSSAARAALAPPGARAAGAAAPPPAQGGDPILVVFCDANGTLGGLDAVLAALALPAFAVRLPPDDALWECADVAELAAVAVKALRRALPPGGAPLVLAGVGFGGVLAHEAALQLDAATDRAAAVALLEGAHAVANPAATLNWLAPAARKEVCQAAAALYPAVRAAAGAAAPSLDAFAARLASISGFDAQLDYVASFKPQEEAPAAWDKRIDALLARLGYYKTIVDAYAAADIFPGQTLVFGAAGGGGLQGGGPGGAWERIRFLVQPAAAHELSLTSGPAAAAAALAEALRGAVRRRADAEERTAGGSALALMSPRFSPDAAPQPAPATDSPAPTICLVLPLNRLCPERRYILRRSGRAAVGTPQALAAPPLARVPLWLLHTERGDLSGGQKELAAALPLPCYGLGMGADAEQCASFEELAAAYCAAVTAMQPAGPYLLLGASVVGCQLAHAMAARLHAQGRAAGLVLLDGCVGAPAVPLHDATWYALFYLLREIGTLRGGMGEFVDHVRGAGSPTQQLKLLGSFKPAGAGVVEEAWDAAVYATLDRAAVLKRLARARGAAPPATFPGPAAAVVPRDRLGRAFVDASRPHLAGGAPLVHVPLEARHTECLLSAPARQAAALAVADAVEALLQRLA
jgi:thioesterase domain-containing protein